MSDTPTVTIKHAGDAAGEPAADAAATPAITSGKGPDGKPFVIDKRSRRLVLRELGVIEEQELIGIVGDPLCLNRLYLNRVFQVSRVESIDGEPVPVALSMKELKVAFQRVDKDGLSAINAFEAEEDKASVETAKK